MIVTRRGALVLTGLALAGCAAPIPGDGPSGGPEVGPGESDKLSFAAGPEGQSAKIAAVEQAFWHWDRWLRQMKRRQWRGSPWSSR